MKPQHGLFVLLYACSIALAVILSASHEKRIAPQIKPIPETKNKIDTMDLVLDRILILENSDTHAIGDSGRAFGCYQITKDCVADVNKRFKKRYTHQMMFNPIKAREVAEMYILIGNECYIKREKKQPTINTMLRNYNGGAYSGYKNPKTLQYIKK
jgi:hypothetical protein